MARRRIGQERLAIAGEIPLRGGTSLDEVAALIDWAELDSLLTDISASAKGELGWPPLALFRALLLATWHDLSDVRLAEALDDRASFRRFCGFAAQEPTPERTAFVRFRAALLRRGLDRALFEAVTRQLDARGVVVRTGTLVDATLLPSASIRCDGEARWAGHRRRKPVHGYKAHVATDQEAGLIRGVEVTTANVHDAAELAAILPEAPGPVYGDTAYSGSKPEAAIRACGGTPHVTHKSTWGGPAALARLEAHNAEIRRVRGRIEKVFGTAKRSYGLRRMRWLGLARAGLQVRLAAMAYNLRRSWRLLRGAPA
ncbi:IS5 family transposase [Roseomonas sp. SSH11]|uniref:IS5 family transposase n=1 Tax=Pararoseomonas baculiformis TaxID=2820812 RepID=A0ABS4AMD6_9PROT|nr:IS5 family transposase [Pararoseomonas baculiformis]